MGNQMKHGVITPARKTALLPTPGRVINARSRKKDKSTRIRLDKLLRSAHPRICIKRRLGGIGDVLMTMPITKALKELIPQCYLVYATDLKYSQGALGDIAKHNPHIDELISATNLRDEQYDYLVDITSTGLDKEKSGSIPPNRIDMFADAVGVDISADPLPIYIVKEEEKEWAKKKINELIKNRTKNTKLIAIQARSNDARRTWPLDYVDELSVLLANKDDVHVILFDWGNTVGRWKQDNPKLHYCLDHNLVETAAIIEQCDVVVCPDSAILHLAGALQKKIVTIFGPIPPACRINYYANATAVVKNLPCQFCFYTPKCMKSDSHKLECLMSITPAEVFDATMKKLSEPYKVKTSIVYGKDLTNKNQDNIILLRRSTDGLGDILMITPAIEALAIKHPEMKIEVACQKKLWPVLQNNPNISKLLDINNDINPRRYFMVIDISSPCARYEFSRVGAGKPVQKSRVEIFAEACGVRNKIRSLKPQYHITNDEIQWSKEFINKVIPKDKKKPVIAVGLRSAETYRNWPEEYYVKLFELLKPHMDIVLLDHSREHTFTQVIDACGFPLRKAISILSQCDGLITVDTGLLHFAAALEIPTVAIFGPIDYKPRCKGYSDITVIKSDMKCIPCWRNSKTPCAATGFIKGYSKCLSAVSAKQVAKVAIDKFKGCV